MSPTATEVPPEQHGYYPARLFTLHDSSSGVTVGMIDYGATIVSILAPDRNGVVEEVTLQYPTLSEVAKAPHYGGTIGRCANRIRNGTFYLNHRTYVLPCNNGNHHLHGGDRGFDRVTWNAELLEDGVKFTLVSSDGDEGYPGEVAVEAVYRLRGGGELLVDFAAELRGGRTQLDTIVNMTNHTYFNLSGGHRRTVESTWACVNSPRVVEVDASLAPTGALADVSGTAFDLRHGALLGPRLGLVDGGGRPGFDHCYVLKSGLAACGGAGGGGGGGEAKMELAATLVDEGSGRRLRVWTTQPGMQLYTANFLPDDGDFPHTRWNAVCVETQGLPDAANHAHFPPVSLSPGARYRQRTLFKLDVEGPWAAALRSHWRALVTAGAVGALAVGAVVVARVRRG